MKELPQTFLREFKDPSTIHEQYTAEMMASVTGINHGAAAHFQSVQSTNNVQNIDNFVLIDDHEVAQRNSDGLTRFERRHPNSDLEDMNKLVQASLQKQTHLVQVNQNGNSRNVIGELAGD